MLPNTCVLKKILQVLDSQQAIILGVGWGWYGGLAEDPSWRPGGTILIIIIIIIIITWWPAKTIIISAIIIIIVTCVVCYPLSYRSSSLLSFFSSSRSLLACWRTLSKGTTVTFPEVGYFKLFFFECLVFSAHKKLSEEWSSLFR